MSFAHRTMQPQHIEECVEILVSQPIVAARYGRKTELLAQAWSQILSCDAKCGAVILDENGSGRSPISFFGITVFVEDEFVHEAKAGKFWHGPELADRLIRGKSPVLSNAALREANRRGGLNLMIWDGLARAGYESHPQLQRCMMHGLIEMHRGYQLKEVIAEQAESGERLAFTLATGGFLWDAREGRYTSNSKIDPDEIIKRPYLAGVTRELELQRGNWAGSWVGSLFDYRPPILNLSDGEQRLLSHALAGAIDEEAAKASGISLSSIKQTWLSIYRRAEDSLPSAMAESFRSESSTSGRGKEKRRLIVGYVRDHPEELRPLPRKRIARASANGA